MELVSLMFALLQVCYKTRSPVWNPGNVFMFTLSEAELTKFGGVRVELWDWDRWSDADFLGLVEIPRKTLSAAPPPQASPPRSTNNLVGMQAKQRAVRASLAGMAGDVAHQRRWFDVVGPKGTPIRSAMFFLSRLNFFSFFFFFLRFPLLRGSRCLGFLFLLQRSERISVPE